MPDWACMVMNMINNEAAEKVANAVEKSKIPVARVARDSGVPRATLVRKMNGGGEFGVYEILRIANAIGIEPTSLLPSLYQPKAAA